MITEQYLNSELSDLLMNQDYDGSSSMSYDDNGVRHSLISVACAADWLRKERGLYIAVNYYKLEVDSDWVTMAIYKKNKRGAEMSFEGYDYNEVMFNAVSWCIRNLL